METDLKIVIPADLDQVLRYVTNEFKKEFTLYGKTELVGNEIRLIDIRVPKQESTSTTTDADQESFTNQLLDGGEDPSEWNMWIHSHHTMSAFWSKTDNDQMESFNTGAPPYFSHMVLSTKGRKAAYTMFKPFYIKADNIKIEIEESSNVAVEELKVQLKEILDKIEDLESEKPPMAEVIKQELIEKNKEPEPPEPKRIPKNNNNPHMSMEEYFEELDSEWNTSTYDIYNKVSRIARISALAPQVQNHRNCQCQKCWELSALRDLCQFKDKFVSPKRHKEWFTSSHEHDCKCKTCRVGRTIHRLTSAQSYGEIS